MKGQLFTKGILFSLLFGVYVFFVQPSLLDYVVQQGIDPVWNPVLGFTLLTFIFLETWAVPVKYRQLLVRFPEVGNDDYSGYVMTGWIAHTVVTMVLLFFALTNLGIDVTAEDPSGWFVLACFGGVIKDLGILIATVGVEAREGEEPQPKKELIADIILLGWLCFGYTILWERMGMVPGTNLTTYGTAEAFIQGFAALMIFVIFIVPLRYMWLLEDYVEAKHAGNMAMFYLGLIILLVVGFIPLLTPLN